MSKLFLNIIPFSHPAEEITFSFSKEKQRGWYAFRADKLPPVAQGQFGNKTPESEKYLYTDFNKTETGLKITIPMAEHLGFAKRYYTYLIDQYFREKADAVTPNFIYDNEIWFKADDSNQKYTLYKKTVVKVDFEHFSGQPQLTISYEGTSKVAKKSVESFIEEDIDTDLMKRIIYNKQIIRYNRRPEEANYAMATIFPVISRRLGNYLGIPHETDFSSKKYKNHYEEITTFFNDHINTGDFKEIIPHSGKWLEVEKPFRTTRNSKMPLSGTYVPLGYNTYLLCNNTRYSDETIGKMDGQPLPVKVKIHSTDNEITQNTDELIKLIEQAYQFSRMYWKSVKHQNLQVTIKYPEMIARMIPYFEDKNIPEFGKNNLWFL